MRAEQNVPERRTQAQTAGDGGTERGWARLLQFPPPRRAVLAGMLVLVLVASVGAGKQNAAPELVDAVYREPKSAPYREPKSAPLAHRAAPPAAVGSIDLTLLTRRKPSPANRDLFAKRSFYVPPPAPPPPPEPVAAAPPPPPPVPPPTAPPLPFTYMGKMTDDPTRPLYFLVKNGTLYHVKVGDVIEGTYRIDSVAGVSLRIIYLPLDMPQLLRMGDS